MRITRITAVLILLSVVEAVLAAIIRATDFSGTTAGIASSDSIDSIRVNSGNGTIMGRSARDPVSLFPTMTTVSGTSSIAPAGFSTTGSNLNVVQPEIVAFQAGIGTALPGIGAPLPSIGGLQPSIGQPTVMLNTGQSPFFPGSLTTGGTSTGSLVILPGNPPIVAASVPFLIVPLTDGQTITISDGLNLTSGTTIAAGTIDPPRLVNPEPASVLLFATGVAMLAVMRRRRRTSLGLH